MTARTRRWLALALAPLAAVAMTLAAPSSPASAAPDPSTLTADDGDENPLLSEVLDSTGRKYLAARTAVEKSTVAQTRLAGELKAAQARRDVLIPQVSAIAAQQYRTGGVTSATFLLNGHDP